nr:hypothetical protein [Bacteroidota bacterium]
MEKERNKDQMDPEQRKWDNAGPEEATGRRGDVKGEGYNEGGKSNPNTVPAPGSSGSNEHKEPLQKTEASEWKGGTPSQGPTTGGMGAAGGGHDTDETDV